LKNVHKKINIIHGPNLSLLGEREKSIYGDVSLKDLNEELLLIAKTAKIDIDFFQSNHEGEIVDHILSLKNTDAIIINPAAYTHTSIAIRDALLGIAKPFIEVHLSNVYTREKFRKKSYLSDVAIGVITGLGVHSYKSALYYFIHGYFK